MPGYLTDADHRIVSDAVAAAEEHTAGEIVTVITDRSDGYTDVAVIWAAVVSFTALAFLTMFSDFYLTMVDWVFGEWNTEWSPRAVFGLALAVGIIKFAGMWLIQLWTPLKFFLIPGAIKSARVRGRAVSIFKAAAERRTHGRTGILIYLSMQEHRAEIVADEAISSKVEPSVWGEAMAAMLAHIRDGRLAEGMAAAVEKVGAVLAEHFPRHEDDVNELPDRLIEL